jgi:integrase
MGLTKRRDSYYVEFRVLDDGKTLRLATGVAGARLKRWKVGCRNRDEARKQEAIIKRQLLEGLSIKPTLPSMPISFGEYAERWLNTAKGSLAVKTHANYRQLLTLYILPHLRDQNITALTWGTIKTLLMAKQQEGLSVNSIRLIRAVISTILTDAAEDGIIPINPVLGQRRKRRASQASAPDVQPLSWEQKEAFELQLDQMERDGALSPSYAMLFRVYLKTGMRPGEGRGLKPGDIDVMGKRIRVERSVTLDGTLKNTKTGETRWVDLSDGILEKLKGYMTWLKAESIAQGKECTWLLPSKTGTLLDESHVVRAFHKVLEAAGLPRFRVYDLRHTFASLLLSSNVPLLYVSHQLGHTKPTITLKYYARWIPSGQVHRVNVLDTANTVITPPASCQVVPASLPTVMS